MKKVLILTILFTICTQVVIAQQFRLIPAGQDRVYVQTDSRIFSAEIKSSIYAGSEELIDLEGLTEIHWSPAYCYQNTAPDIFGKQILVQDSGDHLIQMDSSGDLIATVKTQALVDESWICFEHNGETVTATCISNAIGSVNGVPEMIKTIRFSNGFCDLRISQTQGILSTPSWNQLYNNINQIESLTVPCVSRIWDESLIEKLSIPFGDLAADLQQDDILHIEEIYISPPNQASRKLIKAQFLNKSFDPLTDSYQLSFKQEVDHWENMNGQISQSIYIDTTITYIGRHLWLDTSQFEYPVPVNRIFGTGEKINYFKFNDRLRTTVTGLSYENQGTCFPFVFDYYSSSDYIEGLGGPYYKDNMFISRERNLIYYKKGNEEWGDPFTFTVSTSEKIRSESISIFPNPVAAGSQIFLQDLGGKEMLEIKLMDIHGKQVQSWQLKNTTNQESLLLQSIIPPGLYVLWIKGNEQHQYYSKLVIK